MRITKNKDYIRRDEMIKQLKARLVLGAPKFNTGLETAIEVATSLPAADVVERPRWIPVTERLPDGEAWDRVLVYTDEGNIQTAPKCKVGNGWITHWMPLPEPPKEEA